MTTVRSKYTNPDFQFVRFRLSSYEFGIDIRNLKEIIKHREITAVPGMPSFIEGFIRLRSMVVPVIDLRKRYALEPVVAEPVRIIITLLNGYIAGLVVDEVADITAGCKELQFKSDGPLALDDGASPWDECVEAVIEDGKDSIMIIRLRELLNPEELSFFKGPMPDGGSMPG